MTIRRPRTLLWQLGVGTIAIQVVVLAGLMLYAYGAVRTFHHDRSEALLDEIAGLLADQYAPLMDPLDEAALRELVAADGASTSARVTLIAADGYVIADSAMNPAQMDDHSTRPEVIAALAGHLGTSERFSDTLETDMLYLARTAGPETAPIIVRVALPVSRITAELGGVFRAVGLATLVSLILTGSMVYFRTRIVTQSVRRLAEGAGRFASGDLEHRVAAPSSIELTTLAGALNDMAGQLDQQIGLLHVQRNEQDAILDSMSNGMIAIDLEQRVLSVNRAAEELLGIDGAAARGRLVQEVVREPSLHQFVAGAVQSATGISDELVLERNQRRIAKAYAEPLRRGGADTNGRLILLNDITELRRLEALRADFAANVSHELRTPITNIQGYVETLLEVGLDDVPQAMRHLGVIKRNSDRLKAIVNDVLSLTQLERPQTLDASDRSPVIVEDLLSMIVDHFSQDAAAKAINVSTASPEGLRISANGQMLEQGIGNLVANAIRYSPSGSSVELAAHVEGEDVVFTVRDEGPGMPAEHLPRLFERFYRVDKARSRELGGTGLGLAIVKHIALVHGGTVDVTSEIDAGSTFTVRLPIGRP